MISLCSTSICRALRSSRAASPRSHCLVRAWFAPVAARRCLHSSTARWNETQTEMGSQREFSTRDGAKVVYFDIDEAASGEVLILLPGALGFAHSDFLPQISGLKNDFRILAMDPRGYGNSRPPKRDFPTDFFQRDALDASEMVEKALGPGRKVNVLGWSDGANSGVVLAARRPDLVSRLVIWGGNAYVTQQDVDMYTAAADTSKWSPRMAEGFLKAYSPDVLQSMWTEWRAGMDRIHSDVPEASICRQEAKQLTCPVFLLHGAKDPMVPTLHPDYLRSVITAPLTYRNFPDGKHNIHLRYAEEFNGLVRDFCLGKDTRV